MHVDANGCDPSAKRGQVANSDRCSFSRVVLLLLVSGLIGLQIMALHERLESLGALAELHLRQ